MRRILKITDRPLSEGWIIIHHQDILLGCIYAMFHFLWWYQFHHHCCQDTLNTADHEYTWARTQVGKHCFLSGLTPLACHNALLLNTELKSEISNVPQSQNMTHHQLREGFHLNVTFTFNFLFENCLCFILSLHGRWCFSSRRWSSTMSCEF